MKKMNEFPGAAAKQTPGNTSQTGNSILERTGLNTPPSEPVIRGTSLPFIRSCLGDDLVDRAIAERIVRVI